jgi:hypothetical protein
MYNINTHTETTQPQRQHEPHVSIGNYSVCFDKNCVLE